MDIISRRPVRSRYGLLLVVTAWVVTSLMSLVIVGAITGSGPWSSAKSNAAQAIPRNAGQPLLVGRRTTIAGARVAVRYPVPLPDTSAAREANLTQVWVNSKLRDVGLVFGRGKITITLAPATYQDPAKFFEAYIRENQEVKSFMGRVHGQPALVISPHTARYNRNPAWVEFDSNGIDINIVSQTYGASALLDAANSMR